MSIALAGRAFMPSEMKARRVPDAETDRHRRLLAFMSSSAAEVAPLSLMSFTALARMSTPRAGCASRPDSAYASARDSVAIEVVVIESSAHKCAGATHIGSMGHSPISRRVWPMRRRRRDTHGADALFEFMLRGPYRAA